MTQTTLDDLIVARATDMATHDGDVLNAFYLMAATNQLISDLLAARDRVLANPPAALRVAGAAHAADDAAAQPDTGAPATEQDEEPAALEAELAEETAPAAVESAPASEAALAADDAA